MICSHRRRELRISDRRQSLRRRVDLLNELARRAENAVLSSIALDLQSVLHALPPRQVATDLLDPPLVVEAEEEVVVLHNADDAAIRELNAGRDNTQPHVGGQRDDRSAAV